MKDDKEILGLFPTPVIRFKFEKHEEYVDKWENWEKDELNPLDGNVVLIHHFLR